MSDHQAIQIKQALEQEIVVGQLPPGKRLDEAQLAERFQVSRTPIREAIQLLAANGLVQRFPRRGAFVTEIGIDSLIEMFEVMAELEGMCGRLAARRMSDSEQRRLEEAHASCQQSVLNNQPDSYYALNERFHEAIYAGCHNGFLAAQTRQLRNRLTPYRRLQLRVRNRMQKSFAEHQAIVDAILGGDAATAERLLTAHVLIQGERFSDFVASMTR